jgi:hypothetical protein
MAAHSATLDVKKPDDVSLPWQIRKHFEDGVEHTAWAPILLAIHNKDEGIDWDAMGDGEPSSI